MFVLRSVFLKVFYTMCVSGVSVTTISKRLYCRQGLISGSCCLVRLFGCLVFISNSFQIPNHIEQDCPLTIISCPYKNMGCETKVSTSAFGERKRRSVRDNAGGYSWSLW